ncbi:MAG: hypothetical protein JWQ59_188 [Cryobacterium sp.]|nr:hypothetical protein [Cryobacterium sp.]
MALLRIQHPVPGYERWKRSFESDMLKRKDSGVLRYTIHRSVSDPNLVMVDMEFPTVRQAEIFLTRMHRIWGMGGTPVEGPEAWIVETVERVELADVAGEGAG